MSKRKLNRLALAAKIQSTGEEMIPCSSCASSEPPRACVVLSGASVRCSECVRRGFTRCDVRGVAAGSLSALMEEEERLKLEQDAALEAHQSALNLALESLARVQRLKKQRLFVKEKTDKLVQRVSAECDEEDGVTAAGPPEGAAQGPSLFAPFSPSDPTWVWFPGEASDTVAVEAASLVGFPLAPKSHLRGRILST